MPGPTDSIQESYLLKTLRTFIPYLKNHWIAVVFGVVFVLAANVLAVQVPLLIGETVNAIEKRQIDSQFLIVFLVLALCYSGLEGAFRFLHRRLLIDASRDIEYEMRNTLFAKLESLDPSFFDRNNTGDLMSRATNDMDAVRMLIGPAIMYTANTVFSLPAVLFGMFLLDWKLSLIAMIPMAALPPLVKYFGSRSHEFSKLQQDSYGHLTTMVQENLAGSRVVKAYVQESAEEEKFTEKNEDYIRRSLDVARIQALFFPSIRVIVALSYVILLVYGGSRIISGELQVGTLFSILLLFSGLVWPLIAAGWVVNIIQRGVASLDRINLILGAEPSVRDEAKAAPQVNSMDIEFNDLTFQFPATERPQLQGVTLRVPAGGTLGIVGPVGSGKSTLVNLLARFYPIPRGMLMVGGHDINDWPLQELRRRVAFVFQETFLFSDTIGWNIRFGAEDDTPQEQVERAASRAQVHSSIIEFPKKYDTFLGERGVNLSGGQKQRVAIARAIAKDADVLVLDDSLSAVDTHTEEAILGELRQYMEGRTTFLISHRISTVSLADQIIVIEGGRITQHGTHDELIAQPGLYSELYKRQLSEQELENFDSDEVEAGRA
ncbi:ATP-binding cassette domain-containing protein [bacterium]|nr:ATP-binding cassette domain-containing protein [bacterium]